MNDIIKTTDIEVSQATLARYGKRLEALKPDKEKLAAYADRIAELAEAQPEIVEFEAQEALAAAVALLQQASANLANFARWR